MMLIHNDNPLLFWKDIFAFFATAFYRPEEELCSQDLVFCLHELNCDFALQMEEEIVQLEKWLITEKNRADELLQEYSRLFVGPFTLAAPPFESYYRDGRRVMGNSTMQVKKYYHEAGLEPIAEFKVPPDHLVLELDFLAQLCEFELAAFDSGNAELAKALSNMRSAFIAEHLLCWLPAFAGAVKLGAALPFYPLLAAMLVQILKKYEKYDLLSGGVQCLSITS